MHISLAIERNASFDIIPLNLKNTVLHTKYIIAYYITFKNNSILNINQNSNFWTRFLWNRYDIWISELLTIGNKWDKFNQTEANFHFNRQ